MDENLARALIAAARAFADELESGEAADPDRATQARAEPAWCACWEILFM